MSGIEKNYIKYDISVDPFDFENDDLVAWESWNDGFSREQTMETIIINAANYAACATGLKAGAYHFSAMGRAPLDEPRKL